MGLAHEIRRGHVQTAVGGVGRGRDRGGIGRPHGRGTARPGKQVRGRLGGGTEACRVITLEARRSQGGHVGPLKWGQKGLLHAEIAYEGHLG
mgnify:CR=1 FL=1